MLAALLASVPEEHLISGARTLLQAGKVAFGSKNWELFNKLDFLLCGVECHLLIYASDPSRHIDPPSITWSARYLGSSTAKKGAHKGGMRYRPESTQKYPLDNKGNWVLFWEANELRRLNSPIRISQLRNLEKPKGYLSGFIPRGPILIEPPIFAS
jgi:hypothetical protein